MLPKRTLTNEHVVRSLMEQLVSLVEITSENPKQEAFDRLSDCAVHPAIIARYIGVPQWQLKAWQNRDNFEKLDSAETLTLDDFIERNLDDLALQYAKQEINSYCKREFGSESEADFSDLRHVNVAYTTDDTEEYEITAELDLVYYKTILKINDIVVSAYTDSRDEFMDTLGYLDYNALVEIDWDILPYTQEEKYRFSDGKKSGYISREEVINLLSDAYGDFDLPSFLEECKIVKEGYLILPDWFNERRAKA